MNWMKEIIGAKLNPDEFAELVCKVRQKAGDTRKLIYDKEDFCLRVQEGDGTYAATINLHNAYDEYYRIPKVERAEFLNRFFLLGEVPETLDAAITNILPRVQPKCFYHELQLMHQIAELQKKSSVELETPFITLAEHLSISLAYDGAMTVSYLSKPILEKWSVSIEELMPRAITNLHRLTPEPFQPVKPGFYMSTYEDTHDASRMLLAVRVKECRVKGRPIAVAPNRNGLLITGEEDIENQKLLIEVCNKLADGPRPMPPFPLVYENDQWKLWRASRENPNHAAFDLLTVRAQMEIYAPQKELVDKLYDLNGTDVFVATYSAWQDEMEEVVSSCVWTESVLALLPKTDVISFVVLKGDSGENLGIYEWDTVAMAVGDSLKLDPQFYPPRYRVERFPTAQQFEKMKCSE